MENFLPPAWNRSVVTRLHRVSRLVRYSLVLFVNIGYVTSFAIDGIRIVH